MRNKIEFVILSILAFVPVAIIDPDLDIKVYLKTIWDEVQFQNKYKR